MDDTVRPFRLLVVDDDEVDRLAVKRHLRPFPGHISEAASSDEALFALRNHDFDCVIMDLQLPGRDGRWLLKTARNEGIDTPVIMLTGQGDEHVAVDLMKAGASDYLAKSELAAESLAQSIRHAIRVYQAEREANRAVKAKLESEWRLRLALEATAMGSWDYDSHTQTLECDERCKALFGLAEELPCSFDLLAGAIHPGDRSRVLQGLKVDFDPSLGDSLQLEFRVIRLNDGVERWLRSTGKGFAEGRSYQRFVGTVQDITEQVRSREALKESESRFRTLADAMPQIVWVARPNGQLEYCNRRWREYTGLFAAEGSNRLSVGQWVIHPEDRERANQRWEEASANESVYDIEYRLRDAEGRYRWFLGRALPVRDREGRLEHWYGTATDIHERKLAEEETRKRNEFEQQLIGIVSHDLRNPLNAIGMSASLLVKRGGLSEPQGKAVSRIVSSADRATRLIRDFLDYTQSRSSEGIPIQRKPCNMHELVQRVVDEVHLSYPERNIEVRREGDGLGEWDVDRLEQVVGNLIGNAFQHSPVQSPVEVMIKGEDNEVRVAICNGGGPIPETDLPRLFTPFQRGLDARSSTGRSVGLGLFIAKQIVVAHRGDISVSSTAEAGTCFTMGLPRT